MNISLSPFAPENLVSRNGFGSPVPRQPAHLHTQAESGAYLRDSSRVPRRRPFIFLNPYAIGSVPNFSGHATAYRWRLLPRVRRHKTSKPQGSSKRVLPWQITMDQLIFASLSHTHYWYEVKSAMAIMRFEDRLFDRGWVRSAMATRKCGNIYFPKYFMAVRPFFTRIFLKELFGLEGSKNFLKNFVRCTI